MFVIDVMSRVPVYEQIINQVEEQIMTGILKEGDKMPTNPNTIQKAYSELDRRQMIVTVPGKGSFISPDALEALGVNVREKIPKLNQIVRELALAGISKDEIIENVNKVYEEIE